MATENSDDIIEGLKTFRLKFPQNPIIAQININSTRNKFETLVSLVTSDIDILMISETKIDESFPLSQFMIDRFSMPYCRDRNAHGGGILVYFRNNITLKLLKTENLPSDIQAIFIEMNIKSKKWLLCCTYNPNKSLIENHLRQLQKQLEAFSERYEHFLIMGDFNTDVSDPSMTSFCTLFKLKSIVKEPTCYKNPENSSCIDLFLTNCPGCFHSTCLDETGLSDFHKLVVTILRTRFELLPPKIIKYRNYKNFNGDEFRFLFNKRLNDFNADDITVDIFKMTFFNFLLKFAPLKKKYLRANHSRFVNKELNKAIMQRSRLFNAYLKDKTRASRIAYKKTKKCVHQHSL